MNNNDQAAINQARAAIYGLLGLLFVEGAAEEKKERVKEGLNALIASPFDDEAALAAQELLALLESVSPGEEYADIFLSPFSKPTGITASFYYEQREAGRTLARAREIVQQTCLRRDETKFLAPEDHFGFLFALMEHLILRGENDLEKATFEELINPFVNPFISALLNHPKTAFYQSAAVLLERFTGFERFYLEIDAPAVPVLARHDVRCAGEDRPRKKGDGSGKRA